MTNVVLVGSDGAQATVLRAAAEQQSLLLRDLLDDQGGQEDVNVPVPVAKGDTVKYIAEYMKIRHNNPAKEIERPLKTNLFQILDEVDKNFLQDKKEDDIMQLTVAAGFLNYPALKDLCCARLAQWMTEKSVEEIRAMFGLENDFTPEEIAALKKEHGLDKL